MQEAFAVALARWTVRGIPDNPAAWITTTAYRKLIDMARRERTRRAVEGSAANLYRFHNPLLADPVEGRRFVDREWASARIAERYEWLFRYDATTVAV